MGLDLMRIMRRLIGREYKVLDIPEALRVAQENPDEEVSVGIVEDWSGTADVLVGKRTEAHIWSSWGTPAYSLRGKIVPCWQYTDSDGISLILRQGREYRRAARIEARVEQELKAMHHE